jgi:hypothetical protein
MINDLPVLRYFVNGPLDGAHYWIHEWCGIIKMFNDPNNPIYKLVYKLEDDGKFYYKSIEKMENR